MIYQWTAEQRARLVPGATVVRDGERVEVPAAATIAMSFIDPASLRPPTLAWLRKEARRKLGKGADVILGREHRRVSVFVPRPSSGPVVAIATDTLALFSDLPHLDARSSCAVWLSSLPEVTP